LWSAPVPLVGLAADWSLLFHYFRRRPHDCDLLLTDTCGVECLARAGITQTRAVNLFGLGRSFLDCSWPDLPRDIDILFIGNMHPAVQGERLPWLARIGRLSERRRIAIRAGIYGDAYRELLGRARIVFNRSIRGECNMRALEAAAAGALLFQEAGNREVPSFFGDRQQCVYYTDNNLEELIEYYLDHEEARQAIAKAGRERVRDYSYGALWDEQVRHIEEQWPALLERARGRVQRCR